MMVMRLAQVTEWCNKSDSGKLIGPLMIGKLPVYDVTEALNRDSTPKVGDMSPLSPPPFFSLMPLHLLGLSLLCS